MAPKRAAQADTPSDEHGDAFIPLFQTYDGSPLNKASFFVEGRRCLIKHVSVAREAIASGIIVGTRSTSFFSLKHMQDYLAGTLVSGTIEKPVDFRAKYINAAADEIDKDISTPAERDASGAVTRAAFIGSIKVTPTRVAELGPRAERYQVAHELCDQGLGLVAAHFLTHITSDSIQEEWQDVCGNNGLKFMIDFLAELAVPDECSRLQLV